MARLDLCDMRRSAKLPQACLHRSEDASGRTSTKEPTSRWGEVSHSVLGIYSGRRHACMQQALLVCGAEG